MRVFFQSRKLCNCKKAPRMAFLKKGIAVEIEVEGKLYPEKTFGVEFEL
jgi:hypothetical protein